MKRQITILLILFTLVYIIPKNTEVKLANIETNEPEIVTETPEKNIVVTSRSGVREPAKVEKIYNVDMNTNLTTKSNVDIVEYQKMLEGTALYEIAESLYNSEQKYGVNGLYLMGLACLESAYGKSDFARKRNNIVGWNAVDSNPGKASYFNSKSECIDFVAGKLKKNYLTENGCYFSGYTAKDIDKHYCTDKQHANKIINIIKNLEKKLDI